MELKGGLEFASVHLDMNFEPISLHTEIARVLIFEKKKSTLSGWALWKILKLPECLRQEHKACCPHVSSQ